MRRPTHSSTTHASKQLRYRYQYQEKRLGASRYTFLSFSRNWLFIGFVAVGVGYLFCMVFLFGNTRSALFATRGAIPSISTAEIRIFGPENRQSTSTLPPESNLHVSFQQYTRDEQRDFLRKYGHLCQSWNVENNRNMLLERFDGFESSPYFQVELWKYCMLYIGVGNFYYDANNLAILWNWSDVLDRITSNGIVKTSIAIKLGGIPFEGDEQVHESLLYLAKPKSSIAMTMIRYLVETPISSLHAQDMLPRLLAKTIEKDLSSGSSTLWEFLVATCQNLAPHELGIRSQCATIAGFCCQVTTRQRRHESLPILALRSPGRFSLPFDSGNVPLPYRDDLSSLEQDVLELNADFPFISTVRLVDLNESPATALESPNFFDILLQNDCVPTQKDCHHCLQHLGNCQACQEECPCYCKVLCQIRPPPKRVVQEFQVRPPSYRKDPSRLIPRIVHQTWYEAVTPTKYPNMSRLIQSWKSSGWDYRFYDDVAAAEFISRHFPSHVRDAYDALLPGAFKADLFRYCVLLIHGGVYADMDVLLESNLDHAIAPDVGFMTPIDEPGTDVGHRSCLWNGFLAVAPGHPVMAKVIELVVNHIRNRFTSVDYDDMLCPNPVLSVSHTLDTLFTCGPCILGAALNLLMKRHAQTQFDIGTLDIWNTSSSSSSSTTRSTVTTTTTPQGDVEYDSEDNDEDEDGDNDPRRLFPGRTIILHQNKHDMGAHRFTWLEQNMLVASTDFPEYDDRTTTTAAALGTLTTPGTTGGATTTPTPPQQPQHYSKTHENVGVYGLHRLYRDQQRVHGNIRIQVVKASES